MSLSRRLLYAPARLLLRRKTLATPITSGSVRRVLLLRYDAIGDMIVTLPMVDVLRAMIPGVEVDIVTSPTNDPVVASDPRITRTFIFSRKISDLWELAKRLRPRSYDVVIGLVMHKTTESGLVAAAAVGRKGITVSFEHAGRGHVYSTWFNVQAPLERGRYTMAEMEIRLLNHVFGWNVQATDYPIRLNLPAEAQQYAREQTSWMTGRRIALNLSAKDERRMLSFEKNSDLVNGLLQQIPSSTIVIVCAPNRAEMAERLARIDPSRIRAAATSPTVVGSLAVMDDVDLLVTPDTSIAHGAAGFGTPVVGMYTHITDYLQEWMPFGVDYRATYTVGKVPIETLNIDDVIRNAVELSATL